MEFAYIPQSEVLLGVWWGERPPYHLYHCYRWVFLTILKSGTYWGQGDPALHQELCSFMGVYTSSSCLHQAFSRPSLSCLYACNMLSLRHSQNNRPLRPLWLQGPSILATTQRWGREIQLFIRNYAPSWGFTHCHHAFIKHFPVLHWAAFMHATCSVWGIPKITGPWGQRGLRSPVFRVQPNPGALPYR
jgi:hypothetical protein